MSKKFTIQELEEVAKEVTQSMITTDFNVLNPSKTLKKSFKTPIEQVRRYKIIVESSVFWSSRQAYLDIIKSFLSQKIDGRTFTYKFYELRAQDLIRTNELCFIIEDEILPIPNFYYTFKARDFYSAMSELYWEVDSYDPNKDDWDLNNIVYSETQLRSIIQENFVPILQKSCGLNDSFFQPQIDLDQLIRRSYLIFIMSSFGLLTSLIASILI